MPKTSAYKGLSLLLLLSASLSGFAADTVPGKACLILLHGLARSADSMKKIERYFQFHNYEVVNVSYPSRKHPVATLAMNALPPAIAQCNASGAVKIDMLSHSMGAILIRYYLAEKTLENAGRIVMLSPPNQGSEVVDKLHALPGFTLLNGPAGLQLGTGPESLPRRLGPIAYEVGIITGNKSLNPLLSLLIPGEDDGKVSVSSAQLQGMQDFLLLPYSHTFIMNRTRVMEEARYFIEHGAFTQSSRQPLQAQATD